MRRYHIIMLLKKFIIFYSSAISYPVCGRVWSSCITTVDSRQVGGGAWRGDGQGLFTVQNDGLCCGGPLPPWSKIPMRPGERCVQQTWGVCGNRWWWSMQPVVVVVNASGRRRDDAALMKTFAGARSLHDDRRRRCTGTRVRNITSFACTRTANRDDKRRKRKTEKTKRSVVWYIFYKL